MLRPYQITNKTLLDEAFAAGALAVVDCMPTGAGKTVSFSDYALDKIRAGKRAMILCNRKELIAQAKAKLAAYGLHPHLIIPGHGDKITNLYLASIDTLRNRRWPDIDYLIVDEAHIRAFDPIVLYYKAIGCRIIGATATPVRYGRKLIPEYPDYTGQMGDIYDKLVIPTTISELIRDEYLVPAITFGAPIDLSDIKRKGDDYDERALYEKFNKPQRYAGVVDKYKQFTAGAKALVFNINVEDSRNMTAEFLAAGIPSAHLDGSTPGAERDAIFANFKAGRILVLNNCSVATTGYDEPSIEVIIVNRPTISLSLWLQMCGRGSRPHHGKGYFTIIDMGSNVFSHGFWHDERLWTLEVEFKSKTRGAAPIGDCSNCGALIPLNIAACPYCEAINKRKEETERKMAEAEFVVLDHKGIPAELLRPIPEMTLEQLDQYRELKDYSFGWLVRQLISRGPAALAEYGRMKNYSPSWAAKQMELSDKTRTDAKRQILQFIKANTHVGDETLEYYAAKKLRPTHTKEEVAAALPKILLLSQQFRKGEISIEL